MLDQGSVLQAKQGYFPRDSSHIVITMRFYPRFLKKELRDEFLPDLAPNKELLHDFNEAQKRLANHNAAFPEINYEERFTLNQQALAHLERLSELSHSKDVYLLCICAPGERCHREILMLAAQHLFGCKIGKVFHEYPVFMKRLKTRRQALPGS